MDTDPDSFVSWLQDANEAICPINLGYVSSNRIELACRAEGMTIGQLIMLLLYPSDVAAGVAMAELRDRYQAVLDEQHGPYSNDDGLGAAFDRCKADRDDIDAAIARDDRAFSRAAVADMPEALL